MIAYHDGRIVDTLSQAGADGSFGASTISLSFSLDGAEIDLELTKAYRGTV